MENLEMPLYSLFKDFQNSGHSSLNEYCLSAFGIKEVLKSIYQDNIHILGSDIAFNYFPASRDEISNLLAYIVNFQDLVRTSCKEQKKPIIAFWKMNLSGKNSATGSEEAEKNYMWQAIVIIPKNHININKEPLSNSSELVYMVDSSGNSYNLPPLLKFWMKNQTIFELSDRGLGSFGGIFSSAKICDTLTIKQCENCSQSWLWLIFNTVMLISTGNSDYSKAFLNFDTSYANRIIAILEGLSINLDLEPSAEKFTCNLDLKSLENIEMSILNKLYAQLTTWMILNDWVLFSERKLNISQLCILADCQVHQKDDDALQFIQLLMESGEFDSDQYWTPRTKGKKINKSPATHHSAIQIENNCIFSIGYLNFKDTIDGECTYVDKTIFIKALLELRCPNIAITRPKGWGKSMNMSMLQAFLNPSRDINGKFENLYLFTGGKDNTDIDHLENERCKNIMITDNGKYIRFAGTSFLFRETNKISLNSGKL